MRSGSPPCPTILLLRNPLISFEVIVAIPLSQCFCECAHFDPTPAVSLAHFVMRPNDSCAYRTTWRWYEEPHLKQGSTTGWWNPVVVTMHTSTKSSMFTFSYSLLQWFLSHSSSFVNWLYHVSFAQSVCWRNSIILTEFEIVVGFLVLKSNKMRILSLDLTSAWPKITLRIGTWSRFLKLCPDRYGWYTKFFNPRMRLSGDAPKSVLIFMLFVFLGSHKRLSSIIP